MKAAEAGRKAIMGINAIVNYIVLTAVVMLLSLAGYALWDSNQIYQAADKSNYTVYKPTTEDGGRSFIELQEINDEVIAWLTVYGTNIDYPITQGQDNIKYVNTNAENQYSISGSIFLDCYNGRDFSNFNNILYGHHMQREAMFGAIGLFADWEMFDTHRYGNLTFDGKDHGIEFFAFIQTDAYDGMVFAPDVQGEERQEYLDNLMSNALYTRDIGVTISDRIILLSTCSSSSTNVRDILVGRITDEMIIDDLYGVPGAGLDSGAGEGRPAADNRYCFVEPIPLWLILLIILTPILTVKVLAALPGMYQRHKSKILLQKKLSKALSTLNSNQAVMW